MKKKILLLIVACFMSVVNIFGQTDPRDTTGQLGNFSSPFSKDFGLKFSPDEFNSVDYYFTLNTAMDITVSLCNSTVKGTGIFLFDEEGGGVASHIEGYGSLCPGGQAYLSAPSLPAGTYLLRMDWDPFTAGYVNARMQGKYPDIRTRAIDLGDIGSYYTYSNTQDTDDPYSVYNGGGAWQDGVCYGFYLSGDTDITISHCGSQVRSTEITLLDGNRSPVSLNGLAVVTEKTCSSPTQAYLRILNLPQGQYYVVSQGKDGRGRITTQIEATETVVVPPITELAMDIKGINAPLFVYVDRKITSDPAVGYQGYGDYRGGVCYRFTLPSAMDVEISHCGSVVDDTEVYLLDKDGNRIEYNDDFYGVNACEETRHARLEMSALAAGTYYIVSRGVKENGKIATHILCKAPETKVGSADKNYVLSRTFQDAYGATWQDRVDYFDEMGRPEETVLVNASPMEGDLANLTEYDSFGRVEKEWLQAEAWSADGYGGYKSPDVLKQRIRSIHGNDSAPYLLTQYELSPLNRPLKKYGAGQDWHSKGKANVARYQLTNIEGDGTLNCFHYQITTSSATDADTLVSITNAGNYPSGSLSVMSSKDEDGNETFEFKNRFGQTVLNRQHDKSIFYDTYYIYDEWGNLHAVLPPGASEFMTMKGATWESDSTLAMGYYAYLYKYDKRFRMTAKKLPGQDWIRYVYDKSDHPVFSQDGEQRKRGEWSFSLTDGMGRVCLTGICRNSFEPSRTSLDSAVNAVRDNSTGAYKGYSVSGVTLMDAKVLTVNYYDNYSFMGKNGFPSSTDSDYKFSLLNGYEAQRADCAQSLLTGTFISTSTFNAQPDSLNLYIPSVMYYDRRGRQIQSRSGNHLGGVEQEFVEYDFVGKPLKKTHIHTATGKATQTEEYTYTYDHAGRLMLTKHRLNGGKTIILADRWYDELGRLSDICRHGSCNRLESWYDYNVRSQLKAIHGPLFKQKLYYNDLRSEETNKVCYNGNISAMDWEILSNIVERGYDFTYDGLSRLKQADYVENGMRSPNHFDTSYSYDKQGSIVYLQRYGQTGEDTYGLIDDLQMKYQGNQLKSVQDTASLSACNNGFEFKDGSTADEEYLYDGNGNLIQDSNKKITGIQYNFLNLPRRIEFENGNSISYLYDANGRKLRTTHVIGNDTTVTDYCGNVIYETGVAKTLLVEGGYVSLSDSKYHYFIQDHQGNNRVVADQNGNIEEVNDYYPFGGTFAGSTSVQPYKYNGKELDRKGGLEWYDYGARHYDAALGRWHVMDPMAEKYYGISPYAYCLNNPILFVDPNGMWPTWGGIRSNFKTAVGTSLSFVNGAVSAIADNMLMGTTSLRESGVYSSATAYNAGQDVGDVISIAIGGAEIVRGFGEVTVGVLGSPESAGLSLTVTAKGAVDITHGSLMATSGAQKLFSRKGRVDESSGKSNGYSKSSGKNEKHSNWKAREAAEKKMNAAKERLETMSEDPKFTNSELNKVKKEIKHWKKKMDDAGETHHRK